MKKSWLALFAAALLGLPGWPSMSEAQSPAPVLDPAVCASSVVKTCERVPEPRKETKIEYGCKAEEYCPARLPCCHLFSCLGLGCCGSKGCSGEPAVRNRLVKYKVTKETPGCKCKIVEHPVGACDTLAVPVLAAPAAK